LASINGDRRDSLRRNHTATHLLHWALREVLGDHVRQQGSSVAPDRLRFDFSHHAAPTPAELDKVTHLVNAQVLTDAEVQTTETSRDEAEQMGAIAFFGDKYGESVRVVRAGRQSLEFCGGTHVSSLGAIGSIQIVSEGSIGSNTRRIEAITGLDAVQRSLATRTLLEQVASSLKSEPETVLEALDRTLERIKAVERERDALRASSMATEVAELLSLAADGVVIASVIGRSADELRSMAGDILRRGSLRGVALGSVVEDKVALAVATDGALDAKAVVKVVGPLIGGGGGGSSELAVAGGKRPEGLVEALDEASTLLGGA
jgi:alanyl-tRNA synthetase